jgi:protein SCO1/2
MKIIFSIVLFLSSASYAHDEHHTDLKSNPGLSGASIWHLGSTWKNQNGNAVKLAELKGKPRLAVMLFTRCETSCPLIIEDMLSIVKEIDSKRTEKTEVSIFSLDSFRETPESLKAFAAKRKLPSHWGLHTSDADAVAELAAALGVRYKRLPDGSFIHSNVIYFLDAKGEIVAKKEGIKTPKAEFIKKIRSSL